MTTVFKKQITIDASAGWITVDLGIPLNNGQHLTIVPQSKNLKPRTSTASVPAYEYYGLPSGVDATHTGLYINTGETISIEAQGLWSFDNGGNFIGPDGWNQSSPADFRAPSNKPFMLLGKVGSGNWFPIGSSLANYVPSTTGELILGMNDQNINFANNLGSITANITISNPSLILTGVPATNLVARVGGGIAYDVGQNSDRTLTSCGTLQLATNALHSGNVTAMVYLDAPPTPDNNDCNCNSTNSCQPKSANPIELRTGNKLETETDIAVQTPAGQLAFTRYFRQDRLNSPDYQNMGLGWTHNHAFKLSLSGSSPNRTATVLIEGGQLKLTESSISPGHFDANSNSTVILDYIQILGNFKYVLTMLDKTQHIFDAITLRMESRKFPNNEVWTYSYDASARLTTIDDGYGRQLKFVYINNPGQFNDGKLWRIGDHNTTNLSGTPSGRYVQFTYSQESQNGSPVTNPRALLGTVQDVRGNNWGYFYYGWSVGQNDSTQLNFLEHRQSPSVDTTGDGAVDGSITIEGLTYTLAGSTVSAITQQRGNNLLQSAFSFQPNGQNITTETIAGKTTTHQFANGVYVGRDCKISCVNG